MNISFKGIFQYIVLIIVFCFTALAFSQVYTNLERFLIIVITSIIYVLWGIWHHWNREKLHKNVLIEYILVALLVILLSAFGLGIIRFI